VAWVKGQLVWIETDRALGPVRIVDDTDSSVFRVAILGTREQRYYTKRNPPFKRIQLAVGQRLRVSGVEHEVVIRALTVQDDLFAFDTDAGAFLENQVVDLSGTADVLDLLQQGKFSRAKAFWARQEAWELLQERESHPLRGAMGCRVQLLPHQLWVLSSALEMPVIRALLADEVGLGKTIEAGLVFSALHARRQLKKVLILVPPALKVQWLTESYRRFNIRFRLDHEELIDDDEFRDFIIASIDDLDKNLANFDLLIVDEAHRLAHDPVRSEHLAQLVSASKHVLFLSATPRVHGEDAFVKMMNTLGTSSRGAIKPRVFQSKRAELGLPCYRQVEPAFVKDKRKWLVDFLESKLSANPQEKVFLIASSADEVVRLFTELRRKLGQHFALFHEGMDLIERDRQAAYFADPDGAPFLISSEIGGEGRNFQFCHHMVLLDLPADPLVVEQRIGRLDRLGQTEKVRVWCPIQEDSPEEGIFQTHRDVYRVFEEPWSGSGLEDASSDQLLATRGDANSLQKLRLPYDAEVAGELLESVQRLTRTDIQGFLDDVYSIFGVESEDFDTRGNLRVTASSLMFVDYFPGLGESGERVFTFDRAQSLAREDLTFYSLDHPDFIETIEFLLNSEEGKVAVVRFPPKVRPQVVFVGLTKTPDGLGAEVHTTADLDLTEYPEVPRQWTPPGPMRRGLLAAFTEFQKSLGDREMDAVLFAIP